MRSPVFHIALVVAALAAGPAALATAKAAHETASLTLYEKADFTGRHVTFHAAADTARQAFDAHSAKSVGVWTLCEGKDPSSKCQTVNGPAAKLKVEPAIVRPGVDAVALYEEPELKGRRVIYSFASDQPPPFKAKSARTWGGAWTLCDVGTDNCQTINGERAVAVDIDVSQVQPSRAAKPSPPRERLQLALASPPPEANATTPTDTDGPDATLQRPPSAPPPEPAAQKPAPVEPAPVLAAAEPPKSEPAPSPYVEIPLPPREREAPREQPASVPESPEVRIPAPPPRQAAPLRRVAYVCQDGRGLTVLFDDRYQSAMVLARDQDPVALHRNQGREDGGFFYEGGGHVLFGAGARAGYAEDGSEAVDCMARSARRQLSYRDEPRYAPRFSGEERYSEPADEGPDGGPPDR